MMLVSVEAKQLLSELESAPASLYLKSVVVDDKARRWTQHFYEEAAKWHMQGSKRRKLTTTPGSSAVAIDSSSNLDQDVNSRIVTDQHFDVEQIWGQLQVQNAPMIRRLRRDVHTLEKFAERYSSADHLRNKSGRRNGAVLGAAEDGTADGFVNEMTFASLVEKSNRSDYQGADENSRRSLYRSGTCAADHQVSANAHNGRKPSAKKVKKSLETPRQVTKTRGSPVDDWFFSLEDMESFADEGERLANKDTNEPNLRKKLLKGDIDTTAAAGGDEVDEDFDIMYSAAADTSGDKHDGVDWSAQEGTNDAMYQDFFDPPDFSKPKPLSDDSTGDNNKRGESVSNGMTDTGDDFHDAVEESDTGQTDDEFGTAGGSSDVGFPEGEDSDTERMLDAQLDAYEAGLLGKQVGDGDEGSGGDVDDDDDGYGSDDEDASGTGGMGTDDEKRRSKYTPDAKMDLEDEEEVEFSDGGSTDGVYGSAAVLGGDDGDSSRSTASGREDGGPTSTVKMLYSMDKDRATIDGAVEDLENELVLGDKPWELMGEATAHDRPKNSVLEVNLDVPTYTRPTSSETAALPDVLAEIDETAQGASEDLLAGAAAKLSSNIEKILRFRIANQLFDNVKRIVDSRPANAKPQDEDADEIEILNFEKSKVGLGDVYAQHYEELVMGAESKEQGELDANKKELLLLFAKAMQKLDSLTNFHFSPAPPKRSALAGAPHNAAAVTIEDTIPLVGSVATRKAPEEKLAPVPELQKTEMTSEERAAVRAAKKKRRKKGLLNEVESGFMTVDTLHKVREGRADKNRQAKADKASRLKTGLSSAAAKYKRGKVDANELLAQAVETSTRKL